MILRECNHKFGAFLASITVEDMNVQSMLKMIKHVFTDTSSTIRDRTLKFVVKKPMTHMNNVSKFRAKSLITTSDLRYKPPLLTHSVLVHTAGLWMAL